MRHDVTRLDSLLTTGRWFNRDDQTVIILEEQMAARLGVTADAEQTISLWGSPFTVIGTFKAENFEKAIDLDGEPLTPVIFPEEAGTQMTEEEMEALNPETMSAPFRADISTFRRGRPRSSRRKYSLRPEVS